MSQLIAVIGATGVQGGSVLKAFAADPKWRVRAITRNLGSDSARRAIDEYSTFPNVEWVEADLDTPPSLTRVFATAYAVFGVTQAFDPSLRNDREQERQQGKSIADAASLAGVSLLIWSTLPDSRAVSHGIYGGIKHTYLKHDVTDYIRRAIMPTHPNLSALFVLPASYIQNYLYRFPPRRDADGTVVFSLPASDAVKLDVVNIDEWGPFIHALVSSPDLVSKYNGKSVVACAERITGAQLARTYTEVTGEKARYERMEQAAFIQHVGDADTGRELFEMFEYYDAYGLFSDEYEEEEKAGRQVYPFQSFKDFLTASGYRQGQMDERFGSPSK